MRTDYTLSDKVYEDRTRSSQKDTEAENWEDITGLVIYLTDEEEEKNKETERRAEI